MNPNDLPPQLATYVAMLDLLEALADGTLPSDDKLIAMPALSEQEILCILAGISLFAYQPVEWDRVGFEPDKLRLLGRRLADLTSNAQTEANSQANSQEFEDSVLADLDNLPTTEERS